ncbi:MULTISPECIES: exosortase O [Spirulina sp. CCY15215]|uniref:exosortase O n=1 Tax=Spirulina sp. CCY15215 TaxID=2767591 RepID=UPI00194F192D
MGNSPKMETQKTAIAFRCSLLVAVWLMVHFSTLSWFYTAFRHASSMEQLAMFGVGVVLGGAIGVSFYRKPEKISLIPTISILPIAVIIVSLLAAIALKLVGNIEQIAVVLFLLGSYGILGLFIDRDRWKKGLPLAAIVACIIPLSPPLGSGFGGLPLRVLTAHWVEQFLSVGQISAISSHDIIILENGIAEVDLPCSGIKSIWVGTLFFLGLTWIDKRVMNWRWLLLGAVNIILLFSANLLRVLLLVIVADVFKQPNFATLLHLPLGLFGFILVCGITWSLSRFLPRSTPSKPLSISSQTPLKRGEIVHQGKHSVFIQKGMLGSAIALAIVYHFLPIQSPQLIEAIALPESVDTALIELTPAEQRFFTSYPETIAEKHHFNFGDLSGSLLVVANTSWRSYHPPELCFIGNGLKVDRVEKKQLSTDIIARWLSLQNGQLSATYWLQSKGQTTDDFYRRLWQQFFMANDRSWILVSILFDRNINANNSLLQEFTTEIYNSIDGGALT